MSEIVIRVENLAKQYNIGAKQVRYGTLRDALATLLLVPFRGVSKHLRGQATGVVELDHVPLLGGEVEVRPDHKCPGPGLSRVRPALRSCIGRLRRPARV